MDFQNILTHFAEGCIRWFANSLACLASSILDQVPCRGRRDWAARLWSKNRHWCEGFHYYHAPWQMSYLFSSNPSEFRVGNRYRSSWVGETGEDDGGMARLWSLAAWLRAKYQYFLNTVPEMSLCYGPGLLLEQQAETTTRFRIQARPLQIEKGLPGKWEAKCQTMSKPSDCVLWPCCYCCRNQAGENRKSGRDEWMVQVQYVFAPWLEGKHCVLVCSGGVPLMFQYWFVLRFANYVPIRQTSGWTD